MTENNIKDSAFPKLLFKFKDTTRGNSLSRIDEIISENKLYFPDRKKLNDPFEGLTNPISISGYAGMSIAQAADEEYPVLIGQRNQYKILSLSATCFSPLMWSYYGDECQGICLCFHTNQSFRKAKPITYQNSNKGRTDLEGFQEKLEHDIYKSFFMKHTDWKYEKEWRIVERTENKYYSFKKEELVAVIYGHKIDPGNKCIIQRMLPAEVKQYVIHIGGQTGTIRLLPEEYSIDYSGRVPDYIDTVDALYKNILDNNSTGKVNL